MKGHFVTFHWRDNNGKRCECVLRPGPAARAAGLASFIEQAAAVMRATSDAALYRAEYNYSEDFPDPGSAGPESDCRTSLLLFYRNGNETSSLSLPSPAALPFDDTGPYQGLRLSRDAALLSGLLPDLENLVRGALDPAGRPYGDYFIVGGIIRQ